MTLLVYHFRVLKEITPIKLPNYKDFIVFVDMEWGKLRWDRRFLVYSK